AVLVGALREQSRVLAGTGHRCGDLGSGGGKPECSSVGLAGGDEVGVHAVAPVAVAGRPPSSPLSDRASTAPNGLFNGLIWPKAGCASIAYDATAASNFLPLPAAPSFLARKESPP